MNRIFNGFLVNTLAVRNRRLFDVQLSITAFSLAQF